MDKYPCHVKQWPTPPSLNVVSVDMCDQDNKTYILSNLFGAGVRLAEYRIKMFECHMMLPNCTK